MNITSLLKMHSGAPLRFPHTTRVRGLESSRTTHRRPFLSPPSSTRRLVAASSTPRTCSHGQRSCIPALHAGMRVLDATTVSHTATTHSCTFSPTAVFYPPPRRAPLSAATRRRVRTARGFSLTALGGTGRTAAWRNLLRWSFSTRCLSFTSRS